MGIHNKEELDEEISSLGFVIGTTRSFWTPFLEHVNQQINCHGRSFSPSSSSSGPLCGEERGLEWQPIDDYVRSVLEEILAEPPFSEIGHQVRFSWNHTTSPHYVHIQTAAHVSGFPPPPIPPLHNPLPQQPPHNNLPPHNTPTLYNTTLNNTKLTNRGILL